MTKFSLAVLLSLALAAPGLAATQIAKKIDYHPSSGVTGRVKSECALSTKIPEILAASIPDVEAVDKPRGRRLLLTIRDVHAPGGGMFSGPKWVTLHGTLKNGGKTLGNFVAKRNALRGGGTCNMLNHSVTGSADDIAAWLANPSANANLGDAR